MPPKSTQILIASTLLVFAVLLGAVVALRCNPPKSAADQEKCRVEADARALKRALSQCPHGQPYPACPSYEELQSQYNLELEQCR